MSRNTSVIISRLLNDLGYSRDMIKLRQQTYASANVEDELVHQFICGSKREGLSLPLENDVDIMSVSHQIECRDAIDDIPLYNRKTKFKSVRYDTTASGYTLLKYASFDISALPEEMSNSLVKVDNCSYFLSSDFWKNGIKEKGSRMIGSVPGNSRILGFRRDTQGPSCPVSVFGGFAQCDTVSAIRYHFSELIVSWRNRRRLHDWPSPELIGIVSSLEAHVVPVGYKDSPLHFLEWRICFTKGEIRLIESLNDCQTKLIILLKMIAKHVLKPICKEMSSYVMKNLVLWMAEKYPSGIFVEHKLMTLLKHSLKLLKRCIKNKELPSFMIKERNLFVDRLSESQIITLSESIELLLGEGPAMLLRCPKIRQGLQLLYQFPDQFRLLSERRKCLVPLFENSSVKLNHYQIVNSQFGTFSLDQMLSSLISSNPNGHDNLCIVSILLPDMTDLLVGGKNPMNVLFHRLLYCLS